MTPHGLNNGRLVGFDNAHSGKPVGSHFKHAGRRYAYDHRYRHAADEIVFTAMNKGLRVGNATVQRQRASSLAIAVGANKRGGDEPNVWFPSMAAIARVPSGEKFGFALSHP